MLSEALPGPSSGQRFRKPKAIYATKDITTTALRDNRSQDNDWPIIV